MELEAGGVKGVGQLWGGAYDAPTPLPPRAMTLLDLAKEALDEEALVVLCIQGEVGGSFNPHPTGSIGEPIRLVVVLAIWRPPITHACLTDSSTFCTRVLLLHLWRHVLRVWRGGCLVLRLEVVME